MAYKTQRQRRYESLRAHWFMRFEAMELSSVKLSEAPYLRRLMNDRLRLGRAFQDQARINGWSSTRAQEEFREVIRQEYIDHGWVRENQDIGVGRTAYKASVWEMLKEYRQRAIDAGEYFPQPRKRVRRDTSGKPVAFHISKGDVKAQRRRQRVAERRNRESDPNAMAQYQAQRKAQKDRAKQRKGK